MLDVRSQFPIFEKYIYANTASSGLTCSKLIKWRSQHDQELLHGASLMRDNARLMLNDTRMAVANYFNCKYANVALVQNFSVGINILLEGLGANEKILLLDNDYPSVTWSFERRGFSIFFANLDENLEDNIRNKIIEEDITVLAISIVQWLNGIKIDFEFLKKLKIEFPQLLIIADGTQFCGTSEFNFEASAIDMLGASCYKWLLSGYGNGFMLFKDNVQDRLNLKTIGFNSANTQLAKKHAFRFTKYFEPGHLDTLNFGSLKLSLEFFEEIGKKNIADKLQELSDYAKKEFAALNLLQDAVVKREKHSTIFNIKASKNLFDKLSEKKVISSLRGDGIRLSFHFYNTKNDVNDILKILKTEV